MGKDAVASHLYLQVSLALGELECACPSTEIWLKHRLWVCRPGLGSGTRLCTSQNFTGHADAACIQRAL